MLQELFQEISCLAMSNIPLGKETLYRLKNEMYQMNFSVRNALLCEKPSKEVQRNEEQNWKGYDKQPSPPRYDNSWNQSNWGWETENAQERKEEKRAKSVSGGWDKKSYRSNNSRRSEKNGSPKTKVLGEQAQNQGSLGLYLKKARRKVEKIKVNPK